MSNAVGNRVRALRDLRGYSQEKLAEMAGISKPYVTRIEQGNRTPHEDVLQRIAEALGCTLRYLQTGTDAPQVTQDRLTLELADVDLTNGSPEEAREKFAALATRGADEEIELAAVWGLARAAEALGDFGAAADHLEALVSHSAVRDPGAPPPLMLQVNRCRVYGMAGDVARCIELGEPLLAHLRQHALEGSDEEIMTAAWLCLAYWRRGDLLSAQQLVKSALEHAERAGPDAQSAIYWHSTVLAADRREYSLALDLARKALSAATHSRSERRLARLRVSRAWLLMHLAPPQVDEADAELAEAYRVLAARNHSPSLAACETEMARVAILRGNGAEAALIAGRAIDRIGERASHQRELAHVIHGLALLTIAGRENDGAAEVQHAAQQLQQADRLREAAAAWRDLAEAQLARSQRARADTDRVALTAAAIEAFRSSSNCAGGLTHAGSTA